MWDKTKASYFVPYLKKIRSVKFFFLVSCISLFFLLPWGQLITKENLSNIETLVHESIENIGRGLKFQYNYNRKHVPNNNLKYLLLWSCRDWAPFSFLEEGQESFIKNNCSAINCYVTANKAFFGGNYTKFHAIAFNGRSISPDELPLFRSHHQKYIFFNMESAENYPVCYSVFDGFFNLTATYKLDSDIPTPYVLVKDKNGDTVGPNRKMQWRKDMVEEASDYTEYVENKTKAAAWFVSHCYSRSKRYVFVKMLQRALYPYGYTIDVYGSCGNFSCPRNESSRCNSLLQRDYFFYMSLENSFSEDYVSEKVLTAMSYGVVPIVFGGADYSRFLPPGSYIDARQYDIHQLAAIMNRLVNSPKEYKQFFNWKRYYTYYDPKELENLCGICKALNDKKIMEETTIYYKFRLWWNSNYKRQCRENLLEPN